MSIDAISAIGGGLAPLAPLGVTDTSSASSTGSSGADFAAQLTGGLENLQGLQTKSDDLAVQAATGSLTDVHDYMIASTEAALATQLTVAVRNKAVEAFNEIMRMQA
jgi:flagellar hook-basal body complex protein FliE